MGDHEMEKKSKKKKPIEILGRIIFFIALLGVLYAGFWVLQIYMDAHRISNIDYSMC